MKDIIFCSYDSEFLPYKATQGSIGYDLKVTDDLVIEKGKVVLAPTGVKSALPLGRGVRIYARSSLPVKFGLIVANSVGIIDSDYRGEIKVELTSLNENIELKSGTRIAQFEIFPYFIEGKSFPIGDTPTIKMIGDSKIYNNFENVYPSDRGNGGFGSTTKYNNTNVYIS